MSSATGSPDATGGARATRKEGADGGPRPVPVLDAIAERADVPIYLDGLGSVIAYNTVTVHSRVDGELTKVAFIEGQDVKKGDLLAQIDPRPFQIQLQQAQAALARDLATLRDDQSNLDRYLALRKGDLVPQQQVDDQQALVDQLKGTADADRAQIDNARLQIAYAHITSPLDGRTGVRLVDQGNIVHAADTTGLVVLTQLDPIAVLFTLPEDDLPDLQRQMSGHVLASEAFTRDGQASLGVGQLAVIDNQINQATGTLKLKAIFPNPAHLLWPNQFVKVKLLLTTRKDALIVPSAVIQRGPQGSFAYVIRADSTVEARPVTAGPSQGDNTIIETGLREGEHVVVEGQFKLHENSLVTPKPAKESGGKLASGSASTGGGPGDAR